MNGKLAIAQDRFIEGISRIADTFGLNRFVIQLYALLYLRDKPLSLDEMAGALGVSKGNVSVNIRELEKWGAVRNIWVKGSRKDYYQAEPDIKKVFVNKIASAVEKRSEEISSLLDEFGRILNSANGDLNGEEEKLAATYAKKLNEIKRVRDTVVSAAGMMRKIM
ncbi:MAG: hypothetical protein COV72_02210 [Candidatus Omnitrophica bacterium CG11_big_fil_rev_8_21_14_0_20_42_13]|uniref:HTH-type transcriptional regulator n=1 Tax=Candidatus Ghiorseimicrobium undicola TaxID=1974746 RepID=A0A2H0LYZ5_9BACT|nr:MAG: hypothetical protein COV72_02210 [Candidatus Omnitrophica bacterium CG11_big_fil_rev_8_21_14_0_20_42_13]